MVHGCWEIAWWIDKPIRFSAYEIIGKTSKQTQGDYTTAELALELSKLKQAGNDFAELRDQYEKLKISK
ncbi:MAG: hypothetical protein OCC45_13925 [Desulfotalea sp.]